jgi:hypothetical protein
MKTIIKSLAAALLGIAVTMTVFAQATPRTLDAVQEIGPDGSTSLNIRMTFDERPWTAWKAMVGDQPSRLRASFQHQFAAFAIEDFKVERDDMNRMAQVSLRSPAGPEIREDGSFRIPVEKEFRMVNNTGREWYFSGINPYAGNGLNTIKVILPSNLVEAKLVNAGTADQALLYTLAVAPGPSGAFALAGAVLLGAGVILLVVGILLRRRKPGVSSQVPSPPLVSNIA